MSKGQKILDGLRDAMAGNFTRVDIEGQVWARRDAPEAKICQLRSDIEMLLAKAENARTNAITARDNANLAIEYTDDCAALAVRMLRTLGASLGEGTTT